MRWARLFPHLAGLHVERVFVATEVVHIEVRRAAATARCPSCHRRSHRVHSRSRRHLTDEPVGGRPVLIHLEVRRFRCAHRRCPRRTFAEQAPTLARPRRRRTEPLRRFLLDVGLTVGGRPGARFADRRAISVSRMTLIRLVRDLPEPPPRSPAVLGVDDFALRRGHRYGTVLVDVAESEIIDLLPDRLSASLSTWLTHPQRTPPTFICRDRGGEYASGARQGAPEAIQIADRFHLQKNSSDVLERVLHRHAAALRACVQEEAAPPSTDPDEGAPLGLVQGPPSETPTSVKRARRLAQYEAVATLHQQGLSLTAIAAQVGLCRPTVRAWVGAGQFPERAPRRTALSPGTRFGEQMRTCWQGGVQDATALWQELKARGYRGSVRTVQHAVEPWRSGPALRGRHTRRLPRPSAPATWDHRPPSAQQAVWLLLKPLPSLTPEQQQMRRRLLEAAPEVQQAWTALTAFREMVHTRAASALAPWLVTAESSAVREVRAFAAGVRKDQAAVQAALDYAWSSGRVEGHNTKIKLVKRQMYGRGSLDLLKRRVMQAA